MVLDLENIERIRTQKARYCRLLDTKEFDLWEAIFTPDASVVFHDADGSVIVEFPSPAAFAAAARGTFATTTTVHQTHNSEIEFTSPTEARAIWSMEDWHIYAPVGDARPKTMHGYGFYHEVWRLVHDEWKLAQMDLHRSIVDYT